MPSPPAPAQPATTPVIAIKTARLFDGKAEALQANGIVLVQGPKILAVGTDLTIPAGAEVIDLGDATLSPGFIDAHTHLTGESTDDWKQGFVDNFRREVPEKAIESTVLARKVLEAGPTADTPTRAGCATTSGKWGGDDERPSPPHGRFASRGPVLRAPRGGVPTNPDLNDACARRARSRSPRPGR